MAGELFVDTSAWYPLAVRSHPDHGSLASVLVDRIRRGVRVVTTNLVIGETHALLLRRAGREPALRFAATVRQAPNLVLWSTPELEDHAITDWLERYSDQDFSFTDAVSFAVMRERDIGEALTLDHHFAAAGFRMAPAGGR